MKFYNFLLLTKLKSTKELMRDKVRTKYIETRVIN